MQTPLSGDVQRKLQWSLLALRLGVFLVMLVWTLDKFVNPGHSMKIFEKFYGISGMNEVAAYIMGALQLTLVFAIVFCCMANVGRVFCAVHVKR